MPAILHGTDKSWEVREPLRYGSRHVSWHPSEGEARLKAEEIAAKSGVGLQIHTKSRVIYVDHSDDDRAKLDGRPRAVIRETITFNFDDEAQKTRFHERLELGFADMSWEIGFADQVWVLSLLAQAELDNGDTESVQKTLVRIAEVAAEKNG